MLGCLSTARRALILEKVAEITYEGSFKPGGYSLYRPDVPRPRWSTGIEDGYRADRHSVNRENIGPLPGVTIPAAYEPDGSLRYGAAHTTPYVGAWNFANATLPAVGEPLSQKPRAAESTPGHTWAVGERAPAGMNAGQPALPTQVSLPAPKQDSLGVPTQQRRIRRTYINSDMSVLSPAHTAQNAPGSWQSPEASSPGYIARQNANAPNPAKNWFSYK